MRKSLMSIAIAVGLSSMAAMAGATTIDTSATSLDFSFSSTVASLESALTLGATGSASLVGSGTSVTDIVLPGSSLALNGTSLATWSENTGGLTITSGANVITLSNFAYSAATSDLNFSLAINGTAVSGGGTMVAGSQSTTTAFTSAGGAFTADSLTLTSATASTIANALGYGLFAGTLASVSFGNMTVTAAAQTTTVPEASSFAMMALGLIGAGVLARRRKSA